MNYWKVILATVVIFGAGVFTGGLLVSHVDHPRSKIHITSRPIPPNIRPPTMTSRAHLIFPCRAWPRRWANNSCSSSTTTLKLTPEQHEKIEKIIADGQERNREIWTNTAPKIREVMQEVNQQIRAELAPEQLKPFEELLKHPPRRPPPATNAPPFFSPPQAPTNAPGV